MRQAERAIVIGLDGLNPELIEHLVAQGSLPNIAGLMARGVLAAALPVPPLDTPTNWTSIATGAWPGTHGITSFGIHLPGRGLGDPLLGAFNTHLCRAEFLWDVAERAGKIPFVFDYPVSWPATVHKGVVARPTTMRSVWDPGYLWTRMGGFGSAERSDESRVAIGRYAWDRIYELAELSVYPYDMQEMVEQELGPPPQRQTQGDRTEEFLAFTAEHATYFVDMAGLLQRARGWDLLMCHIHTPDSLHHMLQNAIWPEHPDYDPKEAKAVWSIYAKALGILDEAVG